eukprot:9115019-Pyramimonas_sp.AAC.1
MSRTARASPFAGRARQGRPLALMVAWLGGFPGWVDDQHTHVHAWEPTIDARREARDWLKTQALTDP